MKSKARRILDKWAVTPVAQQAPRYLGSGEVFIWPAGSLDATHYLVARTIRKTPKRTFVEWTCACRGFGLSQKEGDECKHVIQLKEQWEALSANA